MVRWEPLGGVASPLMVELKVVRLGIEVMAVVAGVEQLREVEVEAKTPPEVDTTPRVSV